MPPIPLKLPIGSEIGRDGQVADARLINAYPDPITRDGKSGFALYGAPGLTRWDSGSYIGAERGMIALSSDLLLAVLGNEVVTFDTGGNPTTIGGVTGSGRVSMAIDRETPRSAAIITTDGQYFLVTGGTTVTRQTIANLPNPNSVTYLAGRFLFGISDGRFFCSSIDDGTTVNAAGYDVANLNPDSLVRVYAYNGYAYVFGTQSVEIWAPDPSLANYPFPYGNTKQTITLGMVAPFSLAELDDGLVWVDNEGIVRYGVSGGSARISTHWVERFIEVLSLADKSNLVGYAIEWGGHKAYVLSSPSDWTLLYDLRTQTWYERASVNLKRWRVSNAVQFAGKYICGDIKSGKLFWLNTNNPTEDGDPILFDVQCGHDHRFPGGMIIDRIAVDVVTGIGLQTGNDADVNPQLMIDYSDDGGKTFEGESFEPLGPIGDYDDTVERFRDGLVKQKGRLWRFRATVQALKAIIQAAIYARPARPSR